MIISITISVELMMYGCVGLNISGKNNEEKVSWMAAVDGGGKIVANDSTTIINKEFST